MDFASLQHSVFLHALGSAILNSLWQCFILWLIYETISVSYKSASARFKNNLSTLLLFFSFAWFLTSFISKVFNQQHVTSIEAAKSFALESQPAVHTASGFNTFLSYASASLPYLSVAYIFLLFFLISRLFAAYRYVYFISNKRLIHPTVELQLFACKVAWEIGITKKISVWISHHIDVPATIGFVKPVILIPLASINNLSASQLEAIILHELAHIKRNDYVTNLIISVIETILFFNPFVVLLSGIIKRERENCCDDFVLQYRYDPHAYASALLRLEQSRMSRLKLAIGAVSGKKQLLSRIKRITNKQVVSRQLNYGQKMMALLLVTAIICSVAWLSPEEKKSVTTKALMKEIKAKPLLKTKSTGTAQQLPEVIAAGKQIENLPVAGVKHVSPKTEPVTFPETDIENLSRSNDTGENENQEDDKKKEDTDFFRIENSPEHAEAFNVLSQPSFHFDENNLKFPPSIKIRNFLIQNLNFNIDLSKIDEAKLNENLKLAYKQINALDWNKVQNEIRKSFPKMKLRLGKPSQREPEEVYTEKAKALSKLNVIYARQQYNPKAILEQLKKEVFMQDSLYTAQVTLCNDNSIKIQNAYKKMQLQQDRNVRRTYYYNYNHSNNEAVTQNDEDEDEDGDKDQTTIVCAPKNKVTPDSWKKTVRISIKRTPNHSGVLNEKKPLQFSFISDDEKSNPENVISVEVSNTR